jgi:hypothetical protein
MNVRTQAAGSPAAPTAHMVVADGSIRNATGNVTTAEIVVNAITGNAAEINEITGGAVTGTAEIVVDLTGNEAEINEITGADGAVTGTAEIVVNAATGNAALAIVVGADGADGAATGDYTARLWERLWDVLTGNVTTAEIVVNAITGNAAEINEINEITGADGAVTGNATAATADVNAKPTWQPVPGSLCLAA